MLAAAGAVAAGIGGAAGPQSGNAGFCVGLSRHKDTEPPDTVGSLEPGTCPLLLQWDERWAARPMREAFWR